MTLQFQPAGTFQPSEHLIQMYDTGRSQFVWHCVRCQDENPSAITLTATACLATTGPIDTADDLLKALEAMLPDYIRNTEAIWGEYGGSYEETEDVILTTARAAITKAKGES